MALRKRYGADTEEFDQIAEEINRSSGGLVAKITENAHGISVRSGRPTKERCGVCWNCIYLWYICTVWGKERAWCTKDSDFVGPHPINPQDPPVYCTDYTRRGALSKAEMISMAYLIEADQKEVAGFIRPEDHFTKRQTDSSEKEEDDGQEKI